MNEPLKKAILYLRVSTEEQVENFSLKTQEEICMREAQYRGYVVDKVFREEGRSAKTITGRSILIELLGYCQKNKKEVGAVIIYKTDRLSRQIFDYLVIQQKLSNLGIKLISATEPTDDTPMGKFLGNFFAQIAQLDNDVRSERARNGMRARFKLGLYSGHPPIGYLSLDGVVLKDEKTFEKVKKIWDLMSTGTKSLREITSIMNDWGIPTRPQTISRIFHSKFYMGVLYSPTYQEEVQGQHVPMITREQFNKVQVILDNRRPKHPFLFRRNQLNPDFPLRRLLTCGKCETLFTGAWSSGRNSRYAYYFCRQAKICRSANIPIKHIHQALLDLLETITITSYGKEIFLQLVKNEYMKRFSIIDKKRMNSKRHLEKLHELKRSLIQKHLSGIYSDEIFREQCEQLDDNIKAIKVITNNDRLQRYTIERASEYITKSMTELENTYRNSEVSQKKDLISFLFPYGFKWNYPGLSFSKINSLFRVVE